MLTSVIKHYICLIVNRANLRNGKHMSYLEDQCNLKIYNKNLLKKKEIHTAPAPNGSEHCGHSVRLILHGVYRGKQVFK